MKEKHFDETSDCVYCNAGQPHPRLSRGESYSCGYKVKICDDFQNTHFSFLGSLMNCLGTAK